MADNELERVPRQWSGLQALRTVWMYGNRLRALPVDIFALPQLECEPPVACFLPPMSRLLFNLTVQLLRSTA